MATKPLGGYYRKAWQDFSGGLNTKENALRIQPNQFTQLDDFLINDGGLLEKAPGYTVDGSPFPDDVDSFIRMLVNYRRGSTVDKLVCAALDEGNANATYKVDIKETTGDGSYSYIAHTTGTAAFTNANTAVTGTDTVWLSHLKAGDKIKASAHTDAMYTEIASVNSDTSITLVAGGYLGATVTPAAAYKARIILDKNYVPTAVTFNNNLIISNGVDPMMTYNNTTLNLITDTDHPRAQFLIPHRSRLFAATLTSVYWSAINDETSWDAAAFEPIYTNDGGQINGIISFADSLIVFKNNGAVYQIVGLFDQTALGEPNFIRRVDTPTNMGAAYGYTAAVHDDGMLWFMTETGYFTLDSRLQLTKISNDVEPTLKNLVLQPTTSATKAFTFDSKTQWDTGTYSGTITRSDGLMRNFADSLTISDAYVQNNCLSSKIDSSNNVHIAYVLADGVYKTVNYVKWLASDNSITTETAHSGSQLIRAISLDVASNGNVGIGIIEDATSAANTSVVIKFAERASDVWTSESVRATTSHTIVECSISLKYRTDNSPRIASQVNNAGTLYETELSGVWTNRTVDTSVAMESVSLVIVGDQPRIATFGRSNGNIYLLTSNNDGTSWSSQAKTPGSGAQMGTGDGFCAVYDGTDIVVAFSFSSAGTTYKGQIVKWNTTTDVISVIDSNTTSYFRGYAPYTAVATLQDYGVYIDSSDKEHHIYEASSTVISTNYPIGAYSVSGSALTNNGGVFSIAYFGKSAGEVRARRLAYRSTYVSAEQVDSTLSAWGTYAVTDFSSGGNTVTQEMHTASTSTTATYSAITDGTQVSSDATKIYARFRWTIVLGANSFSPTTVNRILLNYTGTGVDAKFTTATVFDGEYYCSVTDSGNTANNRIIHSDKRRAWGRLTAPVIFFARYRQSLYGGSSTTGKVYKLQTGYNAAGSAYTGTAIFKEDLLGSLELDKDIYKIYVIYEIESAGTFDFSYRLDNFKTSGGATWYDTEVLLTQDGIAEIPVYQSKAQSIQFKVSSDENDVTPAIIGFVVLYGYLTVR